MMTANQLVAQVDREASSNSVQQVQMVRYLTTHSWLALPYPNSCRRRNRDL